MDNEDVLKQILACDAAATQAYEEAARKARSAAADAQAKVDQMMAEALSSAQVEAAKIEAEATNAIDDATLAEARQAETAKKVAAMRSRSAQALEALQKMLLEG